MQTSQPERNPYLRQPCRCDNQSGRAERERWLLLEAQIEVLYRINRADNVTYLIGEPYVFCSQVDSCCVSDWYHLPVEWNGEVSIYTPFQTSPWEHQWS